MLSAQEDIGLKMKRLETRLEKHGKEVQATFRAIAELMVSPPVKPKRPIGFGIE